MKTYRIEFTYDGEGEAQVQSYKATSPGHAFEKCLREFPGAKLLEGWNEGGRGSEYGCVTYPPPSTARIVAEPAPKTEETTFPFYDDCLGTRHSGGAARTQNFSAFADKRCFNPAAVRAPQITRRNKTETERN
jgi:hypothetical protein